MRPHDLPRATALAVLDACGGDRRAAAAALGCHVTAVGYHVRTRNQRADAAARRARHEAVLRALEAACGSLSGAAARLRAEGIDMTPQAVWQHRQRAAADARKNLVADACRGETAEEYRAGLAVEGYGHEGIGLCTA